MTCWVLFLNLLRRSLCLSNMRKVRKYTNADPPPDDLPQLRRGRLYRVHVARRNGRPAGFFDLEAHSEEEAANKVKALGGGWVIISVDLLG